MDWNHAIERNQEALKAIIAALVVMVGGAAERVAPGFHRAVTRVLGPAEAALRRLIVMAARGLKVEPLRPRAMAKIPAGRARGDRLVFRLFDPRKRFGPPHEKRPPRLEPRIHVFGSDPRLTLFQPQPPAAVAPAPGDGLVSIRRLRLRLAAVSLALGDLPRQARRLMRWRARRERGESLRHQSPMRPGRPPGHRKRPTHPVDFVLRDCHGLAWDALALDSS